MGTVEYKTCDRCGKRMEYIGWTARIKNAVKRGKTVKIRKYFNGNPDGYSYSDCYYELCASCTKELENFLSNKTPVLYSCRVAAGRIREHEQKRDKRD